MNKAKQIDIAGMTERLATAIINVVIDELKETAAAIEKQQKKR